MRRPLLGVRFLARGGSGGHLARFYDACPKASVFENFAQGHHPVSGELGGRHRPAPPRPEGLRSQPGGPGAAYSPACGAARQAPQP
eukprot:12052951-Alexandrium_andersonii.AAC.1